jgi:hypothetical protein
VSKLKKARYSQSLLFLFSVLHFPKAPNETHKTRKQNEKTKRKNNGRVQKSGIFSILFFPFFVFTKKGFMFEVDCEQRVRRGFCSLRGVDAESERYVPYVFCTLPHGAKREIGVCVCAHTFRGKHKE